MTSSPSATLSGSSDRNGRMTVSGSRGKKVMPKPLATVAAFGGDVATVEGKHISLPCPKCRTSWVRAADGRRVARVLDAVVDSGRSTVWLREMEAAIGG